MSLFLRTNHRPHHSLIRVVIQLFPAAFLDLLILEDGTETKVTKYQTTLHNIPEEWKLEITHKRNLQGETHILQEIQTSDETSNRSVMKR
jgi:hypothetical protein